MADKSLDRRDAVDDRGDLFLIVGHTFAALDEHHAFVLGHFDAGQGEFHGGAARVFRVDGDDVGGHATDGGLAVFKGIEVGLYFQHGERFVVRRAEHVRPGGDDVDEYVARLGFRRERVARHDCFPTVREADGGERFVRGIFQGLGQGGGDEGKGEGKKGERVFHITLINYPDAGNL